MNKNNKIKITNNFKVIPIFMLLFVMVIIFIFLIYVQFNIDEVKSRRIIHYYIFGKKFGIQITFIFIFINYCFFKIIKIIYPQLRQIHKFKNGYIFHDDKNLYFGEDVIALRDIDKCVNDHSVEFKNPRHKLGIYNKYGKSYWCHYVFKEDPKQLIAQIEALSRKAKTGELQ